MESAELPCKTCGCLNTVGASVCINCGKAPELKAAAVSLLGADPVALRVGGGVLAILLIGVIWSIWYHHTLNADPSAVVQPSAQIVQPAVPPGMLTKDPEFQKLLHPPQGDDLLNLSAAFSDKRREIEAKLSAIQDPELRGHLSDEEWAKVDKAQYIEQERRMLADSFPNSMQRVLTIHRSDWFEVGHVKYPDTSSLVVTSVDASPLRLPSGARIAVDIVTMDTAYLKFRGLTAQQIKQVVDDNMQTACDPGSPCTQEQQAHDYIYNEEWNDEEKRVRDARLVLVGQGDLLSHRVDRLMLIDYETETVLLEIPLHSFSGEVKWKAPVESDWNGSAPTSAE